MRLLPILTAIIVIATLYALVFERDRLLSFAGTTAPVEEPVETDAAVVEDDGAASGGIPVVAFSSTAKTIDGAVILRGRTEAARQVDVRAETTGQIVSEPLRKGAFVDAGQLLCQLDPGTRQIGLTETQSRLVQAEAALREAEINNTAASRLSEGGFASDTRVASAEAAVEASRAAVRSAEAAVATAENGLTKLEIRAPFEGLLESDTAELGELLQPGSLCATVMQLDPIRLVGFVPEAMVERVEVGALAGARLTSGREVAGRVTFLSRSADPNTRTFRVDIEVDNSDLAIRDGQTAEIGIQSDGEVAHLLPQSVLTLNDDGALGVRLVDDGRVVFAPVSVLRDTVDGIWVSGLDQSADVIVVGQEFVTDGVAVEATFRETVE